MANNIGTLIIASIRPFTTTDTIATAYANEIKGGFHTVVDDAERDALLTTYPDRMEEGMVVNVLNSGGVRKTYQLSGGTWVEFGASSDLSSLSTALSNEVSDRIGGYDSLSTSISSGDESLSTSISNEILDRISGDESLSTIISTISGSTFDIDSVMDNGEVLGMIGGELTGITYSTIVSLETSSRISVDETLSTIISTEIINRISGDTSLVTSLSSEISNRISGDTSLSISISSKLSGLTSDLLYWNPVTKAYTPYADNVVAGSAGKFYLGTFTISDADLRLNYTGGLRVNASSNYGIEGSSNTSTGVRGFSDQREGVFGSSNSGEGGSFSSNSGYGVFGSSNSLVGGRFEIQNTGTALEAEGNQAVAALIIKSATLTADDTNELVSFTRATDGTGMYGVSGDIINIIDDPSNMTYVSGSTIKATIGLDIRIDMNPRVMDSGTSVAYMFDTNTGLTESGAKLLSIRNYGEEKFYVDGAGDTWTSGVTISSNTRRISLITLISGGTTTWDMNLSCSAKVYLTGATTLNISNTISGDNGTLVVIQGTTGNITFPSGSKYAGGTPPTLSGGGQLDILSFYYDGTNYYWNIGKNYA